MPILPENKRRYPPRKEWALIRGRILTRAGNKCEWPGCGAPNHKPHPLTSSRVVLTIAHLDHQPENNDDCNLMALCQRCHNRYDADHRAENRRRRRAVESK